jgi:hypothetical protein
MISTKRRSAAFVEWSFNQAARSGIRRHFLNCLFFCAGHKISHNDGVPFTSEVSRQHIAMRARRPAGMYERTTVSIIVAVICSLELFDSIRGDWSHFASSDQIRTLFYRLIIARSFRPRIQQEEQRSLTSRQTALARFRERYNILDRTQLRTIRGCQIAETIELMRFRRKQFHRDSQLLNALDTEDTIHAITDKFPTFSTARTRLSLAPSDIADSPRLPQKRTIPPPVQRRQVTAHPLLEEVGKVKNHTIMIMRKYRRSPDIVFSQTGGARATQNPENPTIAAGISTMASTSFLSHGYEPHQSVIGRKEVDDALCTQTFHMSELCSLKVCAESARTARDEWEFVSGRRASIRGWVTLNSFDSLSTTRPTRSSSSFSLSRISSGYSDNADYFTQPAEQRIAALYDRFMSLLNFFLYGSVDSHSRPDFERLHERIFNLTQSLNHGSRSDVCPSYTEPIVESGHATLMIGLVIADRDTAPIQFKCFGFPQLKSQLESFLHPADDRESLVSLLTPMLAVEQASRPVAQSLREVLDALAARAIASEIGQDGPDLSPAGPRVRFATRSDHSPAQSQTRADQHKMAIRNKLDFADDVISTIFKGHIFITSSMSVPLSDSVDPFVGMSELESVLVIRTEEPGLIVRAKRAGKRTGKGKIKVKGMGKRGKSNAMEHGLTGKKSIEPLGSDDYDFFLFLAPYIIPCELLTQMIREEQRKAKTVPKL